MIETARSNRDGICLLPASLKACLKAELNDIGEAHNKSN